ncbi:MAG: permease-like cell division protein FtsX [Pseudomonadota bacterium]
MFNKSLHHSPIVHYISQHKKALKTSLKHFTITPVTALLTCIVIGVVLTLPMGLFVFLKNIQVISHNLHNSAQITLYTNMNVSTDQITQLEQTLRANSDIQNFQYISPENGLKEFQQQAGFGDVLAELKDNPLPGVFIVYPKPSINTTAQAQNLLTQLENIHNVDSAQLDMNWLNKLNAMVLFGHHLAYVIMTIFFFAVLLIISYTIRLNTQNYQDEIRVIKLLGGTNRFIARPFLYNGMFYGLFGGIIAWLLISGVIWTLQNPMTELANLYGATFNITGLNLRLTVLLLGGGMLLGYFGSRLSVSRYIRNVDTPR